MLAEEGDDPLNRYLLAAVEVRLESARALRAFGQEAQDAFLSLQTAEDLAAIFVLIERFIATRAPPRSPLQRRDQQLVPVGQEIGAGNRAALTAPTFAARCVRLAQSHLIMMWVR